MLRFRLTMGLMCLVVVMLAMGLFAIDRCSQLGKQFQIFLVESDAAGHTALAIKRSTGRLLGAALSRLSGNWEPSRYDFAAESRELEERLKDLARGVTDKTRPGEEGTEGERSAAERLLTSYGAFAAKARLFLEGEEKPFAQWRVVASGLGDEAANVLEIADQLTAAHHEAVRESRNAVAAGVNQTIRALILAMIIAVVAAIYTCSRLTRGLLEPLTSLNASINRVADGNLDQEIPVLSQDELGLLARAFNRMATHLKFYRNSTSEELMRLNQIIRSTLASFPDPIFVLNAGGAVEFRNPAADQLALRLLFSGMRRLPEEVERKVEEVRASGRDYLPTGYRDCLRFKIDGSDKYVLPRIVLLRDSAALIFGVAVILEDVTRMRLVDDMKSNLVATVSHELKTPLTSIRLALYLILEQTVGGLNPKQQKLMTTARDETDRVLRTLNDLLDLSRLDHGTHVMERTLALPGDIVESAVREARVAAEEAGITLESIVGDGLGDAPLPAVSVDLQRISYVFANLLTNAIKYSPSGSTVTFRCVRDGDDGQMLRFEVRDRGPGIAEEHHARLFERFYRVKGTAKTGAGLGLSIAHDIVLAHDGRIGVKSRPGEGSTFYVLLPAAPAPAPAEGPAASNPAPTP
ncbi:hypothetical protein DB346_15425 [Verrucomicrobia bacterium LW23]|nr:hypothetical protein DB346_15425 [Verrucomicrobia bacterium LW23]